MAHRACVIAFLVLLSATAGADQRKMPDVPPPLPPIAPLDLPRALDLYAAGRFDEAVQSVARAGDEIGRHLRRHWPVTAKQWIDADPDRRPQRLLAAAALALETEHLRTERGDWRVTTGDDPPCAGSCVLDWAQSQLVQRGAPDRAERAWCLAAAALVGGVRDWRYLQRTIEPARAGQVIPGFLERALARFPTDPHLGLEWGIAAAGRFSVTVDVERGRRAAVLPALGGPGAAAGMLAELRDNPLVGAEARVRLGYLYWAAGRDAEAGGELTKAAGQAADADTRYLAHFLLGWTAIARGDSAAAIPPLEAALAVLPRSQSAAVALASLELQRGDAEKAHRIAEASLNDAQRSAAIDPWRLFLYGHHPRWGALLAALRREIKP
jgi:tetratricopeptide (TPR) repeat protein